MHQTEVHQPTDAKLNHSYAPGQKCSSLQMPSLTIPMPQDRSVLQPTGCDDQELLHNISSRGIHINSCRPNQKIVVHHTKQLPLSENLLESLRQIKNNIPYSYIPSRTHYRNNISISFSYIISLQYMHYFSNHFLSE